MSQKRRILLASIIHETHTFVEEPTTLADFAIRRGLKHVEAGAQGEHKIARGYLPQTTYSAHYIADPSLRRAIRDYLARERSYVQEAVRELTEAGPFRKTDADS